MTTWTIIGILAVGAGIMLVGVVFGALIAMPSKRDDSTHNPGEGSGN